jgi:uncharacterized membrane protein (UPF0127 family)
MLRASDARIGLVHKHQRIALLAAILIAVTGVGFGYYLWNTDQSNVSDQSNEMTGQLQYQQTNLSVGTRTIELDIADTPAKMHLGLGGRASLATDKGMLFAYTDTGQRCFWMKDMKFSIDILWLDNQKKIGHIEKSLSPDTYPQTYCPNVAAQYVIELQAGTSGVDGLNEGDTLNFNL